MTVVDARVPMRAPGLELLGELQDSGYHESRSIVRRADGQTVQVTPLLYSLLEAIDGERDTAMLAAELSGRTGRAVDTEDVEVLLAKLEPLGLLCGPDGGAPDVAMQSPLLALRWKVEATNPDTTKRVTAPFASLFRRGIVVPVLLAFAATAWWVFFRHGLASGTRQAFETPGLLLGAFLLVVVSAGWHEFGHAAACRAAGAQPGAMGAGIYIVWPAFYTNVEDSRRLGRWGRLVVDLGGLYFNAVAAVAVMGSWLITRMDALLLLVAAQLVLMLRQLAPVIRADGYHILSDLIGVPDLFQHIKPTLAGLLPTNWGKPQPLRPWARWIVRAWVLVIVPLLLWMLLLAVLLLPRLVATAWLGLQEHGGNLFNGESNANVLTVLASLLKVASLILPVAAALYMVVRVARRTARRVWEGTEGRPVRRAGAMALAVAIIAIVGVAWWPAGQYEPVSANEQGTLLALHRMRTPPAPDFEPIANVEPVPGYALIPRDSDAPSLLLVRGPDGQLQSILTNGDRVGVSFPFELPDAPGPKDNQALAVNSEDGSVVYDVAVALVWVTDGDTADSRNEAYALASCTACTTVAVAFQVVLIVGQSDVIAPVNLAVAGNSGCIACETVALAVQLVVTLSEMPSEELQAQIEAALGELEGLEELPNPYAAIREVESEILTLLRDAGLVDEGDLVTNEEADTTTATTAPHTSTTVEASTETGTESTTTSSPTTSSTTSTTSP